MSVTHVAGPVIVVKGRYAPDNERIIQRCVVCGEKLIDTEGQMAPDKPDGTPPDGPGVWAEQALVQIDGNRHLNVGTYIDDDDPEDFCLALVE